MGGGFSDQPGGGAPTLVRSKRTLMSIETIYEECRHSKWKQDIFINLHRLTIRTNIRAYLLIYSSTNSKS